jgi:tetratricopeptide (TPR) repeat protein
VNLYETKGNHAKALEIAGELAMKRIDKERVFSRGAGLLLWEGRTAGARIMMGQRDTQSFRDGQAMLEVLSEDQWFKEESFALFYRDCLAFYLGTRIALSEKNTKVATAIFGDFVERSRALEARQQVAVQTSSYANWRRATNTLGMGVAELKGMLAELEPEPVKSTCVNWYRAASERQYKSANLMPPTMDYPLQLRLGDFYLKQGEAEKAGRAYAEGLKLRLNHVATLRGYREALLKLGKSEAAAKLATRIQAVAR